MTRKSAPGWALAATLLAALPACESHPQAWGEANAIIVVATDSLWQQVGDSVMLALEPTIQTVRDERAFEVTHVSPYDSNFVNLRKFKQVLALGVPGDPWVKPAAEAGRAAPYAHDVEDVWANEQRVTAIVVRPEHPAQDVYAHLPEVGTRLDSLYRIWAVRRMYLSEADTALRSRLAREAGFTLFLPSVYQEERLDSVWVFRNWAEVRGNEVRRTITVASRPGVDTTTSSEAALAWRAAVIAGYQTAQVPDPATLHRRQVTIGDTRAFEVQGTWSTLFDGLPTAGAFLTRLVPCPAENRTYLVDGWLYAPGRATKYEYMVQLQTLLNTFRCGAGVAPSPIR